MPTLQCAGADRAVSTGAATSSLKHYILVTCVDHPIADLVVKLGSVCICAGRRFTYALPTLVCTCPRSGPIITTVSSTPTQYWQVLAKLRANCISLCHRHCVKQDGPA